MALAAVCLQSSLPLFSLSRTWLQLSALPAQRTAAGRGFPIERSVAEVRMSAPITIETCEICAQDFHLSMKKYRAGGGYQTGDAAFTVEWAGDELEDLCLSKVCPNCVSSIANTARQEIDRLRPVAAKRAKKGRN